MPFLEFFSQDLPNDLFQRVKNELKETEEAKVRCLNKLKELIKGEPEFYPCMEDAFLLRYLRLRKFDVEKAFEKLKKYYIYKARHSRRLTDIRISEIKPVLELNHISFLKYRDQNGVGVMLIRYKEYDAVLDPIHSLASAFLCCQIALLNEVNQFVGISIIFDFDGYSLRTAMKSSSVTLLYNMVLGMQDYMPLRIKAIHVVNQPYYVTLLYGIMQKFLTEKVKKRIYFHGSDLSSLHRHLPPDILPVELGGRQGPQSEHTQEFISEIERYEQQVTKLSTYGYKGKALHNVQRRK